MDQRERKRIRAFKKPEPVREVSLVTHRTFIKKRLVDVMKEEILDCCAKRDPSSQTD